MFHGVLKRPISSYQTLVLPCEEVTSAIGDLSKRTMIRVVANCYSIIHWFNDIASGLFIFKLSPSWQRTCATILTTHIGQERFIVNYSKGSWMVLIAYRSVFRSLAVIARGFFSSIVFNTRQPFGPKMMPASFGEAHSRNDFFNLYSA